MPHRATWKVVRRAWGVTSVYQRVVKCCADCRTLRFGMVPRTHHAIPGASKPDGGKRSIVIRCRKNCAKQQQQRCVFASLAAYKRRSGSMRAPWAVRRKASEKLIINMGGRP